MIEANTLSLRFNIGEAVLGGVHGRRQIRLFPHGSVHHGLLMLNPMDEGGFQITRYVIYAHSRNNDSDF